MALELMQFDTFLVVFSLILGFLAGVVKGIVGFAMPMILLSGLTTIVPAEIALGALILPTVVSNVQQAGSQGLKAAVSSLVRFKLFLLTGSGVLLASAQLAPYVPAVLFLGSLGIMIVSFCLFQMLGLRFSLEVQNKRAAIGFGAFAGFVGGMSGVWGPPTVAYLTALDTEKSEQIRVQGVVYGLSALLLLVGHIASGIFTWSIAPFSAMLVIPAVIGVWVGTQICEKIDQPMFRKATLMVLLIAGCNLVRRAFLA
jgi:uncharacterized membrane protein YfcA